MKLFSHAIARAVREKLWEKFGIGAEPKLKLVQDGSLRLWAMGLVQSEVPAVLVRLFRTDAAYTGKSFAEVTERFVIDVLQDAKAMQNIEADKRPLVLEIANWLNSVEIKITEVGFQFRYQRITGIEWEPDEAIDLVNIAEIAVVRILLDYGYYTP